MINNVILTSLDIIPTHGGDVMHAMKKTSKGYVDFGEAYFSRIDYSAIKGWKRHQRMTLNLIVPAGKIRFVLFKDNVFEEFIISKDNFSRLTVPPMVWVAFQGLDYSGSLLLNIASIEHDSRETDVKDIDEIKFNWSV